MFNLVVPDRRMSFSFKWLCLRYTMKLHSGQIPFSALIDSELRKRVGIWACYKEKFCYEYSFHQRSGRIGFFLHSPSHGALKLSCTCGQVIIIEWLWYRNKDLGIRPQEKQVEWLHQKPFKISYFSPREKFLFHSPFCPQPSWEGRSTTYWINIPFYKIAFFWLQEQVISPEWYNSRIGIAATQLGNTVWVKSCTCHNILTSNLLSLVQEKRTVTCGK